MPCQPEDVEHVQKNLNNMIPQIEERIPETTDSIRFRGSEGGVGDR